MANTGKSTKVDPFILKYMGVQFNPDKYVFHLLLVLTLMFMILYTVGTSVPAWYVLEENVNNVSTCRSADRYLEPHVRRYWNKNPSKLLLTSSLWFINVHLTSDDVKYTKFVPFIFAQKENLAEETRNGMIVDNMFPKCLTTIITFTFLSLGVAFTCCASNRPGRLIYFGLSSVMIVAAITTWVSVAITTSEKYLLSVAFDLCLQQGALKTSFLLQMVTGSAGILAFIFGCILIHIAILINNKFNTERMCSDKDDLSIQEQLSFMYQDFKDSGKGKFSNVYNL
ncbi:uncharacterized protein LOC132740546 [Ruditapes philippinarum]|uniref:uncharacterized protein LOC132740546 n=1 Tax=Ruditapes philippinarum TaxID=129788 RepID=UPI00295AD96B|nr:uncharacterized protein LOC132740546 [Ruditapes philippinarum]